MRKNYTPTKDKRYRMSYPFQPETDDQWQGNQTYWKDTSYHGISIIDPNTNKPFMLDRWSCRYGEGWTYTENGTIKIPRFLFLLEDMVNINLISTIYKNEPTLFIDRITSATNWQYRSDKNKVSITHNSRTDFQPLNQDEYERIKYILNTNIDDCYIWDKFQEKCIEIFDGLNKGKFIDYK